MLNQYRYSVGKFQISFHCIDISGSDVESFLQSQSTFNISLLKSRSFHLVSFLDPQGRTECYGWLLHDQGKFTYLVPKDLKETAITRLNRFLISEDVVIGIPDWKEWTFILGPDAHAYEHERSYEGCIFSEKAFLGHNTSWEVQDIPEEDVDLWLGLSGWPRFDGTNFKNELITNTNLFELSVSSNKGCYPGQETVSKIATRRGAAFSPVLIEVEKSYPLGPLVNFDKKIGEVTAVYSWIGTTYLSASLIRDFRVEGMNISFEIAGEAGKGIVRYFPLLPGDNQAKAKELFYDATDFFKKNNVESAEECLKLSIKLDPTFADSYESLGVMLGRLERYDEAIDWMKQLSVVDPKSVLAHTNMSLFLMRLGKIDEAEEQKSQATLKSFATFGVEAKMKEVEDLKKKEKENEWQKREAMFLQVLEIDPEDTLANYGIGSIAIERQNWDKARVHLEIVIKADPHYSVAYLALGKALKGLGKVDEANSIWKQGISVAAARGDLMPANQMLSEIVNLKL